MLDALINCASEGNRRNRRLLLENEQPKGKLERVAAVKQQWENSHNHTFLNPLPDIEEEVTPGKYYPVPRIKHPAWWLRRAQERVIAKEGKKRWAPFLSFDFPYTPSPLRCRSHPMQRINGRVFEHSTFPTGSPSWETDQWKISNLFTWFPPSPWFTMLLKLPSYVPSR